MELKSIAVLSADDVCQCIDMPGAITAMIGAFSQLSAKKATVPLRVKIPIPSENADSLFMPAYLPENGQLGLKTVSTNRNNPENGLPMIHALVQLFDAKTGIPQAVMDGEVLTAFRTGAASGIATRILSNPSSKTAAVIGAGVQGRTQLEAVCCVRDIEKAYVYDLSEAQVEKYAAEMSEKLDISVIPMKEMAQIGEADVICTATSSQRPLFDHAMLKEGVHINAIGAYRPNMCEIPAETVSKSKVFVDQKEACLTEAGDLIQPMEAGLIDESHISVEIGEVILGTKTGRLKKDEITFFKSVGVAVQDLAVAGIVLEQAKKLGLGSIVPI
jgi:ornithine cyclodeaminase/alanine dehydrogenase-like protein (mu-crystallin family)